MWDRAEAVLERALRDRGPGVRPQRGRRRLLRPEDRPAHDRLDRALVAAGHGAAGLLHARALRAGLHRRRQRRAPAGDDPPRPDGLVRALHRHPDRALRRRAAGVAGARCRRSCCRSPTATASTRAASSSPARSRCARRARRSATSRSPARSATPSCARSPTCWWSATASRRQGAVSVRRAPEGRRGQRLAGGVHRARGAPDSRAIRLGLAAMSATRPPTRVDEIVDGIYRISTPSEFDITFNQFLIDDERPALIHTGVHQAYESVRDAVAEVLDPAAPAVRLAAALRGRRVRRDGPLPARARRSRRWPAARCRWTSTSRAWDYRGKVQGFADGEVLDLGATGCASSRPRTSTTGTR